MKKRKTIALILQFVITFAFIFSSYQYVQKTVADTPAYVFTRNISKSTQIEDDDVKVVNVPKKALTQNNIFKKEDVVGKYANTDVYAGNLAYKNQMIDEGKMEVFEKLDLTKMRKISLPINYLEGFGGELRRGDRVDLIYTGKGTKKTSDEYGGAEEQFTYSKIFLQDVLVWNVTTGDGYKFVPKNEYSKTEVTAASGDYEGGEKIEVSPDEGELKIVTLMVTLEQAEEINARLNTGNVKLVGRFDESSSYETLGYVLGDYGKVFTGNANAETSRATINENVPKAQLGKTDENQKNIDGLLDDEDIDVDY